MKDSKGKKRRERPDEDSQDTFMESYTPEQRRTIRKGLRIWARVAIRSYMRKHGVSTQSEDESGGDNHVAV